MPSRPARGCRGGVCESAPKRRSPGVEVALETTQIAQRAAMDVLGVHGAAAHSTKNPFLGARGWRRSRVRTARPFSPRDTARTGERKHRPVPHPTSYPPRVPRHTRPQRERALILGLCSDFLSPSWPRRSPPTCCSSVARVCFANAACAIVAEMHKLDAAVGRRRRVATWQADCAGGGEECGGVLVLNAACSSRSCREGGRSWG